MNKTYSIHVTHVTWRLAAPLLAACLGMVACSAPSTPADTGASAQPAAARPNATEQAIARMHAVKPHACDLLTQAEMTRILGRPVRATGDDPFTNKTICTYTPTDGSPGVRFMVEWGSAAAAATAMGITTGAAAADADGLGDGAKQIGPAWMIVVGDDLVTLEASGLANAHEVAKRMLAIAGPRMRGT